jgi:tetratricopeptide (TPR) repeat protein
MLMELANCYKMTGNINKALVYLTKADSLMPNIAVKIELANLLYNSDRYFDALNIYRELLGADTSNIYLLRSVGHCYNNLELKDSAMFYYEKAAKLNPVDFQSVYRACLIYLDKRAYLKGINITRKFLLFDSTDIRINRMNAYMYLLNSNYDTAVSKFNRCILANDTSLFVNKYLGVAYFKLEKYDTAKIFLERAYFKDSMDAKTCNFLGISCIQSYYKKLGIKYLKRAIQLTIPDAINLSSLYKNLAEGYNGFYKPQEGLEAFLKALEVNPKDTMLLYKIAWQYDFELKQPENSLSYYRKFLKTRQLSDSSQPEKKIKDEYSTYDEKTKQLLNISYYDLAEKRIKEIQDWLKKKEKNNKTN